MFHVLEFEISILVLTYMYVHIRSALSHVSLVAGDAAVHARQLLPP